MSSESRSNSESDRSQSNSPNLNQAPVRTPGYGLERSGSNSPDDIKTPKADNYQSDRSRSHSGSKSRESSRSSRSRSNSPLSNKSWGSPRSEGSHHSNKSKTHSEKSRKSRSRSVASSRSAASSKLESHRSPSGGDSDRSKSGASSRSRSRSGTPSHRSGSAASNRSKSEGSNRSRSPESRSRSRSKSRSVSGDRDHSEKSHSNTPERKPRSPKRRSQSRERGSHTPEESPERSQDLEERRSRTPNRESRSPEKGSDQENDEKAEASAAALFGDADDISSDEERDKNEIENEGEDQRSDDNREEQRQARSDEENDQLPMIEDDEDKEIEEQIPETRIDVEIPKISCDLGRDIHFVKLPNFLSVETRPFDPETYEDEIDEEETLDEEGRARLKLKVENTIRWREVVDDEGNLHKESNARIVKWSDGSLSLHLGSEIFDVYKQPLQGDHNHLFIRQGTGLQGQAVFRTKLSFRPHSTESFTHRKMTLSLADRSQKTSGIKILSQVGLDPDQDRKTLLKKEDEKLRQTVRAKPKKRGDGGSGRSHINNTVYREEEGSDEDGAISLNAIKNKYKSGVVNQIKAGAIYSSDEDGSDFETTRPRKMDKPKALKDSESSEESE